MMKRRRSSEEVSRSPTPAANMYSNSDSSFEMERPKSSRHRDRSGQPSEGHSRRGRHGKEKSKVERNVLEPFTALRVYAGDMSHE